MPYLRTQIKHDLRARLSSDRDAVLRRKGMRGVYDSETFKPEDFESIAWQIDTLMDAGTLLKDGGATKVAKITRHGRSYVIKRYNWRGWRKGIRYMLKGSRARRVWFYGHLLPEAGVHTPQPVGWLEKSKNAMVRKSYIIHEYVPGVRLHDYLCDGRRTRHECVAVLKKMREVFENMHSHRITHGDMKRSNVLVAGNEICLIDLDAVALNRSKLVHRLKRRRDIKRFAERMHADDTPPHIRRLCRQMLLDHLKQN